MLNFKEITLKDKEYIKSYLEKNMGEDSEFTFTNLFIWRKGYKIFYDIIDEIPCLFYFYMENLPVCAIPVKLCEDKELEEKALKAAMEMYISLKEKYDEIIFYVFDKVLAEKIEKSLNFDKKFQEDIDSFDYVYLIDDLINLSGKKYHTKKNHVNKFKKKYNWTYESLDENSADECLDVFDRWRNLKEVNIKEDYEREAVSEIFSNWNDLNVKGGAIRVDGKMVAFSIGEPMNEDTVVIHFEYADNNYDGVFPMINQQFLINQWSNYKYVNREEDMGILGMRKAKQSYRPVYMVKKYNVKI